MYFLIGILVLIIFVIGVYLYIRIKVRKITKEFGMSGKQLSSIIKEARLEDQEVPKSLASMDRIYLEQIKKDFPDININELKRKAEKIIIDCCNAIEKKDPKGLSGKIKSFVEDQINDYEGDQIKYNNLKIHNTVISSYKKENNIATIYFSTSFEYVFHKNGENKKIQDRIKTEFIYIIDETKISKKENVIGIHCPNCGSPITNLGEKKCAYCGSAVKEIISKVFTCNDIVRY